MKIQVNSEEIFKTTDTTQRTQIGQDGALPNLCWTKNSYSVGWV